MPSAKSPVLALRTGLLALLTLAAGTLAQEYQSVSAHDLSLAAPLASFPVVCSEVPITTIELQPVYYSEYIPHTTVIYPFQDGNSFAVTQAPTTVIITSFLTRTILPTQSSVSTSSRVSMTTLSTATSVISQSSLSAPNSPTTSPSLPTTTTASNGLSNLFLGQGLPPGTITDLPQSLIILAYTYVSSPSISSPTGPPAQNGAKVRRQDIDDGNIEPVTIVNLSELLPTSGTQASQDNCDDATPLVLRQGELLQVNRTISKRLGDTFSLLGFQLDQTIPVIDVAFSFVDGILRWNTPDVGPAQFYDCGGQLYAGFNGIVKGTCTPVVVGAVAGPACLQRVTQTAAPNPTFTLPSPSTTAPSLTLISTDTSLSSIDTTTSSSISAPETTSSSDSLSISATTTTNRAVSSSISTAATLSSSDSTLSSVETPTTTVTVSQSLSDSSSGSATSSSTTALSTTTSSTTTLSTATSSTTTLSTATLSTATSSTATSSTTTLSSATSSTTTSSTATSSTATLSAATSSTTTSSTATSSTTTSSTVTSSTATSSTATSSTTTSSIATSSTVTSSTMTSSTVTSSTTTSSTATSSTVTLSNTTSSTTTSSTTTSSTRTSSTTTLSTTTSSTTTSSTTTSSTTTSSTRTATTTSTLSSSRSSSSTSGTTLTTTTSATRLTSTLGSSSSTTTTLPPPAQSCGNTGLGYAIQTHAFINNDAPVYSSVNITYFKMQPPLPGQNGSTKVVNYNYGFNSPPQSFYGGPSRATTFIGINHRGYLFTLTAGIYNITVDRSDDISFVWLGQKAYSTYTRENADIVQGFTNTATNALTYQVAYTAGLYIPLRILAVNGQGATALNLRITAPNGLAIVGTNTTAGSPYLVQYSCDEVLAPRFPPFGQEI